MAAKALLYLSLLATVWLSHSQGLTAQLAVALLTCAVIGVRGVRRGSLAPSGALAAALVGCANLGCSLRCGAALLAFFFASSKLTRYAEERKDFDEDFKAGGQRDWKQVFCNALLPACAAVMLARYTGGSDIPLNSQTMREATKWAGAILGYYGCCCGDTWSSEVGQLSKIEPRLITTGRPVRPGTNGGVTPLGFGASIAGGLFMGTVFYAAGIAAPLALLNGSWRAAAAQWQLVPLGLAAGLVGSVIDSILGATIQFTGFNRKTGKLTSKYNREEVVAISGMPLLSNNLVNLLSATLCAWLTSRAVLFVF